MLSLLVYGRNDHYGYNPTKRLALSLNALAEILTDPSDEILFVDYNSPNDLPTAPEAIADTLTNKTKLCLRIFRVRPEQHRQIKQNTPLNLLEPVARNIGLRRSHPHNPWILSTNPDMLFVPHEPSNSLTDLVRVLPDGFYSLPRLEIPEQIWESAFDRLNPQHTLTWLRQHHAHLRLHTTVQIDNFLQYDNPGDFQLLSRQHLFEMGGFDERMIQGWHVDANLCKRASLWIPRKETFPALMAFHCNHTRQGTPFHHPQSIKNSWHDFVENPAIKPCLDKADWGMPHTEIEEIRLYTNRLKNREFSQEASQNFEGKPTPTKTDSSGGLCISPHMPHIQGLLSILSPQPAELLHWDPAHYNTWIYSSQRVFAFLADHLCYLPKTAQVAYMGANTHMIQLLNQYLTARRFQNLLICLSPQMQKIQMASAIDLWIFDFGLDQEEINPSRAAQVVKRVARHFVRLAVPKKLAPLTKCIGINVLQTDIYPLFQKHLAISSQSLVTGIVYGYMPAKKLSTKRTSMKRIWVLSLHYWLVRYAFNYTGRIRNWIRRSPLGTHLK